MNDSHSHDISKRVKLYLTIGAMLIAGTFITVYAAKVNFGIILGIIVAIIIATVKGTLVAGHFMHLFHERKWVYGILALTAVFIVVMVGLFLFCFGDQQGVKTGAFHVPQRHVDTHYHGAEHAGHGATPE